MGGSEIGCKPKFWRVLQPLQQDLTSVVADNVSVGVGEIVKQFDGIYASVVD